MDDTNQQQQDFDQFFDFSQAVNNADDQALIPFSASDLSPMPCPIHPDILTCDCQSLAPEFLGLPDDLDSFMQDLDPSTFEINPPVSDADFGSMSFNAEIPVGTCADNFGSLTSQSHTTPSVDGTDPTTGNTTHLNSPFNNQIIPGYDLPGIKRPDQPCDYCRSKRLECFVTFVGSEPGVKEKSCNACKVLFRPCSFVPRPNAGPDSTVRGYMDTLSQIHEDSALQWGEMTGVKPLITLGATYHDVVNDRADRRPDKALSRFSRATVQILRDWLDAHADHPYPTEEEKDQLQAQTGLQRTQISNWLANARRRGKVKLQRRDSNPDLNGRLPSAPVNIPGSDKAVEDMSPFERWRHSPPENEPARHSDIAYAMATTKMNETDPPSGQQSKSNSVTNEQRSTNESFSQYRGAGKASSTTTSLESVRSWQSGSQGSKESGDSRSSYNSFARRHQRRRRRRSGTPLTTHSKQTPTSPGPTPAVSKAAATAAAKKAKRPFNCTFCTDTFNSKYDWARHEKSLHLSLERWTCCPNGPVEQHETPGSNGTHEVKPVCAYCLNADPTPEHINTHNHQSSFDHSEALRTFYRKDHLRQHLRLVHSVPLQPHMEKWKSVLDNIRSRCGFCQDVWFTSWSERADHLAKHFRAGMTMDTWKGDWGFDAEIQKLVCNAIAPFLLANEAKTPSPFSATTPSSMRCGTLIKEISEWAIQEQNAGVEVTDDVIKRKARVILYDDEDGWNQTPADNPEWLAWCKKTFRIGPSQDFTDPTNNWGSQVSSGVPREPWDFGDFATRQQLSDVAAYTQGQNPNAMTMTTRGNDDVEMEGIMEGLDLGAGFSGGNGAQDEIFSMDINDMTL